MEINLIWAVLFMDTGHRTGQRIKFGMILKFSMEKCKIGSIFPNYFDNSLGLLHLTEASVAKNPS